MVILDIVLRVLGWIAGGFASMFKNDKPTKQVVEDAKDNGMPDSSVFANPDRMQRDATGKPGSARD